MSSNTIIHPTIFREYIGAKPESGLNGFPVIINPKVKEFHFVLSFATEGYNETTKKGNGIFSPDWDHSIYNAESIQKLKNKYKNAKVVISIGGRGSQNTFDPAEKLLWLSNAKDSIKKILNGLQLIDGIDVYYENIVATNDFVHTIGELIKSLKTDGHIKVASIAPSVAVQPQYKNLYQSTYGDYIDWVDYQFYYQKVANKDDFVNLYNNLSIDYPRILLAGFSTDPSDADRISREVFLEGCQDLLTGKLLPGISVWNAEDSDREVNSYLVEKHAQQMMVDSNHTKA